MTMEANGRRVTSNDVAREAGVSQATVSIVLNGTTEVAPSGLYRQLKEGGRLVGVFALSMPARATIVTRSHGDFGNRALFDATAPVLPGLERLPAFVF